jgi:uncharacterized membrane protein
VKAEAMLFAGIAVFFAAAAGVYNAYAHEPAGKTVLIVCVLMSSLIAFYCQVQYTRRGVRAQDRTDAEISDTVGPLTFFAPHTGYPPLAGAAVAIVMLGLVVDLWLCWVGGALLLLAIVGMLGEFPDRQYPGGQPSQVMPAEALHPEGPPQDRDDQPSGG